MTMDGLIASYPETHQQGWCSVENLNVITEFDTTDCDFGVQISYDGRIWVCINGVAFLRFKPKRPSLLPYTEPTASMASLGADEIGQVWKDRDGYRWRYWNTENVEGWMGEKQGAPYVRVDADAGFGPYVPVES